MRLPQFSIPPFLLNKFVITALVFLVWLVFFDRHNLINQFKLKQELTSLEKEKVYYQDQAVAVEAEATSLFTSAEKLEKFAREEYFMKKDNEEVFVIVEE
ncbi:septum formation initiator family protein [soil metagenome]